MATSFVGVSTSTIHMRLRRLNATADDMTSDAELNAAVAMIDDIETELRRRAHTSTLPQKGTKQR
jgi:hypothetical protein